MTSSTLDVFQDAVAQGDKDAMCAAVANLPADALPEARKLAAQIEDPAAADEVTRAVDDRAAELGVALSA